MSATATDVLTSYTERYVAAWHGRDLDAVEEIVASETSWIDPFLPGELTDLEGAHGFFDVSWEGFPELEFELIGEPLLDPDADRVCFEWRMTGTSDDGKRFDVPGADVITVGEDGRAISIRAYYDVAGLVRQLEAE